MGEFSEKELETLDYLASIVVNEIYSLDQEITDKDRLDYSFCSDDFERIEESKKKMEKVIRKIDKCSPSLSVFLIEFAKPTPEEFNFDSFREHITKNFLLEEYQELIIELAKLHPTELEVLENYNLYSAINSLGYSSKPLKEYIKGVCNVNNYLVYKSLIEQPYNNALESSSTVNEKTNITMSTPSENSALKSFTQELCKVSELKKYPFSELYPWYFYEFTSNLKDEIINNLTSLNEKQFHLYLEYVKDKITEAYVYDTDEGIIDRWLKEYELDEKDFPFYSNEKICKLLSSFNDVSLSKDEASKVRSIQLQFHWYSVYLEYNKIISFILDLSNKKISENTISKESENSNPYPRIFKDAYAFSIFKNLLEEFGNDEENLANYSFVYLRMKKDELIFDDIRNLQFIYFLLDFDINIDRIKPLSQIGKKAYRESIYSKAKQSI